MRNIRAERCASAPASSLASRTVAENNTNSIITKTRRWIVGKIELSRRKVEKYCGEKAKQTRVQTAGDGGHAVEDAD